MGEAKRRGTYEQRKAVAIDKHERYLATQREKRRHEPSPKISPKLVALLAMTGAVGYCIRPTTDKGSE